MKTFQGLWIVSMEKGPPRSLDLLCINVYPWQKANIEEKPVQFLLFYCQLICGFFLRKQNTELSGLRSKANQGSNNLQRNYCLVPEQFLWISFAIRKTEVKHLGKILAWDGRAGIPDFYPDEGAFVVGGDPEFAVRNPSCGFFGVLDDVLDSSSKLAVE